ncbi:MAG: 50S ribosomal protein L2 [Planctomycetota bacterium]
MAVRQMRPTTAGRRQMTIHDFRADLSPQRNHRSNPHKALTGPRPRHGGRNNHGRATVRFRGGGAKRLYRKIDFCRTGTATGKVLTIEYDPNRSANICLIEWAEGEKSYILHPKGLEVGATVMNGADAEPVVGNCIPLEKIPQGEMIHAIETRPGKGAKIARSAGMTARLQAREGKYTIVVLPSGEIRKVLSECRATIGSVGNADHQNISQGKAGRNRWRGFRPHPRAMSMNPVDHPMGGGSARRKGHHPQSPFGLYAKGGPTRAPKALSNTVILRRRKK